MDKIVSTTVEKLEENSVKLSVTVSAEEVTRCINDEYKTASTKYRFNGFRPGKVPRNVIDNLIGKEVIFADATNNLIDKIYPMVLDIENLTVLDKPELLNTDLVHKDADYSFQLKVSVKPELELTSYEPVEIEMPAAEPTESEINEQVDMLRNYYFTYEDVEGRPVQDGDTVAIKMESEKEGEKVDALTFDERNFELGKDYMPKEFDENLIGMNIGETKKFDITFDGDSAQTSCEVTINSIRTKLLPEVNDEFAQTCGFDDLATLTARVRESIAMQKGSTLPRIKEQECLDAIGKRLIGEAPEAMINISFGDLAQRFFNSLQQQGITFDVYLSQRGITADEFQGDLQAQAKDIANQNLALDAIARKLAFEVTEEDIDKEFNAPGIEDPAALRKEWEDDYRLGEVREAIARNKAIEWLLETAIVTEVDPSAAKAEEVKAEEKPAKKKAAKKTTKKAAEKVQDSEKSEE
ncbi:MAG: trigger factor [Actinobacteria bacterium]|nr:trigger factor [Actinomycetota bacterium]